MATIKKTKSKIIKIKVKKSKAVLFNEIIKDISENNVSFRDATRNRMAFGTFYKLINNSEGRRQQYARACDLYQWGLILYPQSGLEFP